MSDEEELPLIQSHRPSPMRRSLAPVVIGAFLIVVLWMGIANNSIGLSLSSSQSPTGSSEGGASLFDTLVGKKQPDFERYVHLRTLDGEDFGYGEPGRRLIVVGDIHGMDDSLQHLLDKVSYDSHTDTLVHLGDIVTKGPHSLRVLSRLAAHNTTGVRGNHDEMVIEWRSFMDWVKTQKGGKKWFNEMVSLDLSPKEYKKLKKSKKKFQIPEDWEWGSIHFQIALQMSQEQYDYLRSLPLILHVPVLHTFFVHAGLLAADPKRSIYDKHQPLSHLPSIASLKKDIEVIRAAQELSILTDVPQNRDPWNILNIRDITKKGKISRKTGDGRPWSDSWNEIQELCHGFDRTSEDLKKKHLPCYPTTVVFGHAAKRGLDIKRWSIGLDAGCVYGRRLSALVFGDSKSKGLDDAGEEEELEELRYGDSSKARLVNVKCREP